MRRVAVALIIAAWLAATPAPGGAQPQGPPFLVNTFTDDLQGAPAIASAANGTFVIAWESFDQDGDYIGIFAQRFAADGSPSGSEIPVNDYVDGPQEAPAVGLANDGRFVVVWQGYGEDGDNGDVWARSFSSAGVAAATEFQVNDPVADAYEGAAAIAALDDGFVIVWDDYEDVFAHRLDAAGAPLGDPFQVNTNKTFGFQGSASVAPTADGGFVIAWEDGYFYGDGYDGAGYGIFARRYDAAGAAQSAEFQVNSTTTGDQYGAAVAPAAGGFVVVWQSYSHAGTDAAVFGQRFDASNDKAGSEFRVNPAPADYGDQPRVAADQAGNFVVVWSAPLTPVPATPLAPPPPAAILARRFNADGTPLAATTPVSASAQNQIEPAVAAAPDGRYVVAWRRDDGDGSQGGVFAQRYAAINSVVPTATQTPSATTSATPTGTSNHTPTVTASPTAPSTSSATATATRTATPSATSTRTRTATRTGTSTPTATRSATATHTATALPSPSASATRNATASPSATATRSVTPSTTATARATATATRTATASATPSVFDTPTRTASASATPPASPTHAATPLDTASSTPAASATASASPTASVTRSASHTATAEASPTPSATRTASATATDSPSPSHTASHTAMASATPTLSATVAPSATPPDIETPPETETPPATETAPPDTPTLMPTAVPCAGDCNGDGMVAINELVTAVGYALDGQAPATCEAVDGNRDGEVTVDELVRVVSNALNGC